MATLKSTRRSYDSSSTDGYRPATLTLAEKRPGLPASTPAPGPSGRANPYAPAHSHTVAMKKSESQPNLLAKDPQLNATRMVLERQCMKLPYDVRETVVSIVNSCYLTADAAAAERDSILKELHSLRREVKTKTIEVEMLYKRCDKYKDTISLKEELIEQMTDEELHSKEHQNKSVRSITRLAKTNRVLIGAFEALGRPDAPSRPKSTASEGYRRSYNKRTNGSVLPNLVESESGNLVVAPSTPGSVTRQSSSAPNGEDTGEEDFFETGGETKDSSLQNGKIRASLLRMARDYYKMVKNIDLLNTEVEVLTTNLRYSEKRNRQMQLELEELKENASISSTGSMAGGPIARPESPEGQAEKGKRRGPGKTLESVDKRLADLASRRAFDPLDGIKQMRLILMHMASAPSSLLQDDVANHLCSREVCRMFEVDAISLFVLQPGGEHLRKYTSRGVEYVTLLLGEGKSVAEGVLRSGREVKINSHKSRSKLDPFADGCQGVHTRKLMCIPLLDASNDRVVGCMQFINKYQNFKFSEVDDLFAAMFGDLAGSIISSALLFSRVWDRSLTLTNIVQASTSMFTAMPDAVSLTSAMPLDVDQVLLALEESARRCLDCTKVKAFVASGAVGMERGSMVALEDDKDDAENKFLKRKHKNGAIYTMFPEMSGIAGMVMRTGRPYLMMSQASDQYHNPQADMCNYADQAAAPMLTVPVVTLSGETIAVIQLLRGPRSPKLVSGPSTVLTGRILFEEAARWLSFQLSFSLQHVLAHVGHPCNQPTSIPEPFEPMTRITSGSLALKPIALGGKASVPWAELVTTDGNPDEDDTTTTMRRSSSTNEDPLLAAATTGRRYSSDSSAVEVIQQRRLGPIKEGQSSDLVVVDPQDSSSSSLNPQVDSQITVLQAEIKLLKKTIGRLSTIDLTTLKNTGNKKSPVPTISEDDDYGSSMGLFFSDDDLDGGRGKQLDSLKKETVELKEDNEYLRGEIESLKELCASAAKAASSAAAAETVVTPPAAIDTTELEARVAAKVREEMRLECEQKIGRELEEINESYMLRIREQDVTTEQQARENAALKERTAAMSQQLSDTSRQAEALRASLNQLTEALEKERARAAEAEAVAQGLADKLSAAESVPTPDTAMVEFSSPPQSREVTQSPRVGTAPPPLPADDQQPTSPRYGGWARFVDENNYPYYHNEHTGETSWERPEDFPEHEHDYNHSHNPEADAFSHLAHQHSHLPHSISYHSAQPEEGDVRVGDWVQRIDSESGMPYWRNDISGESLWELPADAHEDSVGQLHLDDPSYINSSQASGYHSPGHSVEHQGSVSSIDYGAASAGDYKIEL